MKRNPSDTASQTFDLIVIGAGVNGAGVARDAAMRGLKVLLLDKGDISSGTSAWSTRLIHGGLRYLEHGEVGLVRESLREREHLLRIAPHLVRPLPMLIPVYARARRGLMAVRAGMILYDLLSHGKSLERHRMLSPQETLRRAPGLVAENLRGAARYYDAQVEYAERLVFENALSAARHGATVLTYARVDNLIVEEAAARGVEFTDLVNDTTHVARGRVVLNVSGPWVDEVLARSGWPAKRLICGTKGSHLVVDEFAGAPASALYVEAQADGRPFFIIPWNGAYLIGTTDLPFDGSPDEAEASEDEISYLLAETNRVIPQAQLTRAAVRYTYSGIRPLPCRTSRDPSGVTRRHFIRDHAPTLEGFLSIVGGKLTTYRSLSEQAVGVVFKKLGREAPECRTAEEPLPGAGPFKMKSDLTEAVTERLLKIYGARAAEVLKLASEDQGLREPFSKISGAIAAEVVFSFREEMAQTLTDCLWRRTMVGMNAEAGLDAVEAASEVARKYLNWDDARAAREVDDYRDYVRRFRPRAFKKPL